MRHARAGLRGLVFLVALAARGTTLAQAPDPAAAMRERRAEDEVIYFVLPDRFDNGDARNDRGGSKGGRLEHGFDPTRKGFYHGGDLAGLTRRLDYIAGLGATTIWIAPVFTNKPVQGEPGRESAGYHGYWITDFTGVDPHFGTRAELQAFVDAAHARGLKVYLDIVINHTADVIRYRQCPRNDCTYRSRADYPWTRRDGVAGAAINDGFAGDAVRTEENFQRLTAPDYAWSPYLPEGEEEAKRPAWLNELAHFHNRGESTFKGESSLFGDFAGLDDVFTEHPRVVAGMIDVYGRWIDDFGIDGYRVDTARHVDSPFWQQFIPAMLARAGARGIPNFHLFGEVYDPDPAMLARFVRVDRFPAVIDFAFQAAAADVVSGRTGTDRLARLFDLDRIYPDGEATARGLPTFLGNHDLGRFAHWMVAAKPRIGDQELVRRVLLGHALLMFARGVPVVYYGDEQGFIGEGAYDDAREDMFATRVDSYADNRIVGGRQAGGEHFDTSAPLYRAIAAMAAIRAADPALRRGDTVVRGAGDKPGLFAFSRRVLHGETLVVLNTGDTAIAAQVSVESDSRDWAAVHGRCAPRASAPGSYAVAVAPLDWIVCRSDGSGR